MNQVTWMWLAIAVLAVVLIVLAAWVVSRIRRRSHLKQTFGPEYDHTVEEAGSQTAAEAELAEREKRVEGYEIRELSAIERDRFAKRWQMVQSDFVEKPEAAVAEAEQLVQEVLETRGFPVGHFEQRQADLSVRYPQVVHHYRDARELARRNREGEATTEQRRQAMQHYRALCDRLLGHSHPESEVA